MNLVVTGGCGFIGSAFIRRMLNRDPALRIRNIDCLTYAGSDKRLWGIDRERYEWVGCDIRDREEVEGALAGSDAVVHFAAESHVDNSIAGPVPFTETNALGTHVLLEAARQSEIGQFVYVSTDEVYGSLDEGAASEDAPLLPNSPYAASKAAGDAICRAYSQTFGMPIAVTRAANNYGPAQHPEKLIPTLIRKALAGEPLPLYGDGMNVREWLHVDDHCAGLELVLRSGVVGVFNLGSGVECPNLEIARAILREVGGGTVEFVSDRLGHDRRYAMNSRRAQLDLGWYPRHRIDADIPDLVAWYRENADFHPERKG